MDTYALLLAATLNAGTVLALAALGLLIHEKAGVINLGTEGMMLCAAIGGFATVVHTGSDMAGFAAGMAVGGLMAAVFGCLVIGLGTNPYATGLALSLFGAGFSAFVGVDYVKAQLPGRTAYAIPWLSDIPWWGEALFRHHPLVYICITFWTTPGPVWFCAPWANHQNRHTLWAIRFVASVCSRSWQGVPCVVWPGLTFRSSTRPCGYRAWLPAKAGSLWR